MICRNNTIYEKMIYQYDGHELISSSYLNNTTGLTYYNNTRLVKSFFKSVFL